MLQAVLPSRVPVLFSILASFGLRSLPTNQRCGPHDTHAGGTLDGLLDKHGEDHLIAVLRCMTGAKVMDLASDTIGAVSDVLLVRSHMAQDALESIFANVDLADHRKRAVTLRPWPVRQTMRVTIDLVVEEVSPLPPLLHN